jgi:RimJ/RimL family protein N-acetyltransferase
MNFNIWQGEKVRLRAIEPEDWQIFNAWNLDSENARLCYAIPFPASKERDRRWAADQAAQEPKEDAFNLAIENHAHELVGIINTHTCSARNGTFSYGLAVQREHQRKGYASDAILLVLRYYFLELRYQKVNAGVYSFNAASIRLHERLGFQQEGRLRRMTYTNGRFFDDLIFGMTVEEFKQKHSDYLLNEPG